MIGRPDGILTWNNNDLAGAAIVAQNFASNGYIKYANGLILQWILQCRIEFKGAILDYSPDWHRSEYISPPLNMKKLAWLGITPSSAIGKDNESYRLEWAYTTENNFVFALYNYNQGAIANTDPWYGHLIVLGKV